MNLEINQIAMSNSDETLLEFLEVNRLDKFRDKLVYQGVESFDDLADVDLDILESCVGMTLVEANRMIRRRDECLSKMVSYNTVETVFFLLFIA